MMTALEAHDRAKLIWHDFELTCQIEDGGWMLVAQGIGHQMDGCGHATCHDHCKIAEDRIGRKITADHVTLAPRVRPDGKKSPSTRNAIIGNSVYATVTAEGHGVKGASYLFGDALGRTLLEKYVPYGAPAAPLRNRAIELFPHLPGEHNRAKVDQIIREKIAELYNAGQLRSDAELRADRDAKARAGADRQRAKERAYEAKKERLHIASAWLGGWNSVGEVTPGVRDALFIIDRLIAKGEVCIEDLDDPQ